MEFTSYTCLDIYFLWKSITYLFSLKINNTFIILLDMLIHKKGSELYMLRNTII
jgi:hypothetical protein